MNEVLLGSVVLLVLLGLSALAIWDIKRSMDEQEARARALRDERSDWERFQSAFKEDDQT